MKKLVSLILILCLTIGCIYIPASADGNISATESNFTEADDNKTKNEYVDYISVVYPSPDKHDTTGAVTYSIDIVNKSVYNYIEVSYAATENIVLSRYTGDVIKYGGDTLSLPVSFTVDDLSGEDVILDYHSNIFGQINVTANAYLDGEVVDTVSVEVCVLNTPYGAYVGTTGRSLVFDAYISELHSLSILSDLEYKQAVESLVTLSIEYDPNNYDEAEIEAKRAELRGDNRVFKYYDKATKGLVSKTQAQMRISAIEKSSTKINQARSTTTNTNYYDPVVIISRSITVSGSQVTVSGTITWSDVDNSSQRIPLRNAKVNIMDQNLIGNTTLTTVYTDLNGQYTATITNDTGWIEQGYDIYVEVRPYTNDFEVKNPEFFSTFNAGYYFCTSPVQNVKSNVAATNTEGVYRSEFNAFYIHQALVAGYYYFRTMNNNNVPTATVYYPHNDTEKDNSFARPSANEIHIYQDDFCNWDVIIHELGHIAQYYIGAYSSCGGKHQYNENLIETYGKDSGVRIAWNEGWASYFSIASQKYYNSKVVSISNISSVANFSYDHIQINKSNGSFSVAKYDYINEYGLGEGDEGAITTFLLNLVYDTRIAFSDKTVWNITKSSAATRFSQFLNELYDSTSPSFLSAFGYWLDMCNFTERPLREQNGSLTTNIFYENTPPKLFFKMADTDDRYDFNGASSPIDYKFIVVFRNSNYDIIYQTGYQYRDDAEPEIQLSAEQWATIVNAVTDGICYWGLASYESSTPYTGLYYSRLRKITIQ